MYGAFKETKKFLQRKPKFQDPRPDNFVFRLHYQYTFGILAIACLLVTSYSYIDSAGRTQQRGQRGDTLTLLFRLCYSVHGGWGEGEG